MFLNIFKLQSKKKKGKRDKKEDKERPLFDVHRDAIKAVWGVIFMVLFAISILSLFGKAGTGGHMIASTSEKVFGLGKYSVPLAFIAASFILFASRKRNAYLPLVVGGILFFSGMLGVLDVFGEGEMSGGYWGYFIAWPLIKSFGETASIIVFLGLIFTSIIISLNLRISRLFRKKKKEENSEEEGGEEDSDEGKSTKSKEENKDIKVKTWIEGSDEVADRKDNKKIGKFSGAMARNNKQDEEKEEKAFAVRTGSFADKDFRLPPAELLEKETGKPSSGDIVANANIIKRTLQNFGIEVEMGEVSVGPTVTQFTLKPAEGVKLSKIIALHNDLSLSLAAHPIRIEAPIPGRSLVGVEIPNKGITIVRLKNLIESSDYKNHKGNLVFSLGRDVSGTAVYADLTRMPHLLIAGSTGSGKTICLNSIILSLLYQGTPSRVKLILVDPKRVEFPVYSDIPHLLAPVVVETQKTVNALKWTVAEMERRFEVLAEAKARDIGSFNSNKNNIKEFGVLPYIVVVIDELADIMASRGKEVEALIVRLAQMARAVGIHLILATQRPSVEVITGLIKANITSRIAFQVASQIDSRTVLDMAGAEKLLGNGDMLFMSGDGSKPRRIQGAYVSEKEVRRVADFVREEGNKMQKDDELSQSDISESKNSHRRKEERGLSGGYSPVEGYRAGFASSSPVDFEEDGEMDDELYEEAKTVVIRAQKASASLLQRRLRVGYARAARLLDLLEENNIIGPGDGAKPREVYLGKEDEEVLDSNDEGQWKSV
ncbi:MAG: hypothetical protein A3B96_01465 [Candidatus Spechtbacteria bacterium RIFCSPHIGHO2_02_FULL_43_15b]|nr:MAG: hypothetical protein A3B96_01465 [Candidatus Spechtbacteria bacterium RIFCSPHIGHO2_02_FULL_43_15b]